MNAPIKQSTEKRKVQDRPIKSDALELYHVIVQCTDETQQRELYERLSREGFPCRVVVL